MSTARKGTQGDDVGRLLEQLDLAAFGFRSFNRSGSESAAGSEFQPTPAQPEPAPAAAPIRAAIAAPITAAPVDEAFDRLARHLDPRARALRSFKLALQTVPPIVEPAAGNGHDLTINDVLNRLYRLGGSKISLIRQRGDA